MKKISSIIIGVALISSVFAAGCLFNAGNPTPIASPSTTYDGAKFTIQYPSDWTKDEPKGGPIVVFFDLPTKNATENLNVQVWNISANDTLSSITTNALEQLQTYPNFTQIDAGDMTLSGNPAFKLVYTATIAGDDLQLTQIWTVKNRTEYVITYQGSPANYNKYESTAQQMIESFQIK